MRSLAKVHRDADALTVVPSETTETDRGVALLGKRFARLLGDTPHRLDVWQSQV